MQCFLTIMINDQHWCYNFFSLSPCTFFSLSSIRCWFFLLAMPYIFIYYSALTVLLFIWHNIKRILSLRSILSEPNIVIFNEVHVLSFEIEMKWFHFFFTSFLSILFPIFWRLKKIQYLIAMWTIWNALHSRAPCCHTSTMNLIVVFLGLVTW